MKSQFYLSFWRSNLISCERVVTDTLQSQFYLSFWRSNHVSCVTVARDTSNRNITSVFDDRTSFRAKELRRTSWKRNFPSVFDDRIEPRFVRKSCAGQVEIAIYLSFWRSNLVSCEKVAFRAVSLALPLPPPSEEK